MDIYRGILDLRPALLSMDSDECIESVLTGKCLLHKQQIYNDFEKDAHFVNDEC